MRRTVFLTVLLAVGLAFLVSAGSDAMVAPSVDLRSAATSRAITETAALRRGGKVGTRRGAVRTRHAAVRHRGVAVKSQQAAVKHPGAAARTRHAAVKHRSVAPRRTQVAVGKGAAGAVRTPVVVRPVRPWIRQPYYGTIIDGVPIGTVVAANAVPTAPSFDLCWYWSNTPKTRGYWDFCQ